MAKKVITATTKSLQGESPKELVKMRNTLRKELYEHKLKNTLKGLTQTHLIRKTRKAIARTATVLRQKTLSA
jgi:ribosomal protein L29